MKVYIRAVSIEELQQKYSDIKPATFKLLINLDPTADFDTNKRGKYMPWVFKQYKLGNITDKLLKNQGNYDTLRDALDMFAKEYRRYPHSDINQYKTVDEFMEDTHAVGNSTPELSKRQKEREMHRRKKNAGDQDMQLLAEDGPWQLWKPLTQTGDDKLASLGATQDGEKASWCTAYTGAPGIRYWNNYSSQGPIYVFINQDDLLNKYQTCIEANQWFVNRRDIDEGKKAFLRFLDEHENIGKFFDHKIQNGVETLGPSIVGFDDRAVEIVVPDGVVAIPNYDIPKACKKVVLPESVTSIGSNTFQNSNVETLEYVHLDTVGKQAFKNSAIKNISFADMDKIEDSAFRGCKNLTKLDINPRGEFGASCFADNDGVTGTVTIKQTMALHSGVFNNCPNLTLIWDAGDIPDGKSYDIDGIKLLVVNPKKCPNLVACNTKPDGTGYIPMRDHL